MKQILYFLLIACTLFCTALNCGAQEITVSNVTVSSNLLADTTPLNRKLAQYRGQPVTRELLQQLLDQVTDYYHSHGYPHSQAFYPPQDSNDGNFEISLVNPTIDGVLLSYRLFLRKGTKNALFEPLLNFHDHVDRGELHSRLRALGTLDALRIVSGEIQQNEAQHIYVKTHVHAAADTYFYGFADNHGSKSAGRYRMGGYLEIRNPLHMADNLSLFAASSNELQKNFSLTYKVPVNSYATVLGATLCYSDYDLAAEYRELGAQGHSFSSELFIKHPYLMGEYTKGFLHWGYRYKSLVDELKTYEVKFKKHTTAWHLGADYSYNNFPDNFSVSGSFTSGKLKVDDDWGVYENDSYSILNADLKVSHYFKHTPITVLNDLTWQFSPDLLDSSERFSMGGPHALAALDAGAASADTALLERFSLRYSFDSTCRLDWQLQFVQGRNNHGQSRSARGTGLMFETIFNGLSISVSAQKLLGSSGFQSDELQLWLSFSFTHTSGGHMTPFA
ncbi:MAG: ShlB/FhaC/HecB family hemolysin secretion/activation protein [Succinivibrio sp.]|nr:ShlB/FhaC/HecB family hemolysin secretion/activation protein [Succinivibrio sp.]